MLTVHGIHSGSLTLALPQNLIPVSEQNLTALNCSFSSDVYAVVFGVIKLTVLQVTKPNRVS